MTSDIQSKGTDLDSIFSPYKAGTTQQRSTGISVNGADLNTRYANITYGTQVAATGIHSEGADLNTLFCTGATYTSPLPIDGQTYQGSRQIFSGSGSCAITFAVTGGGTGYEVTSNGHAANLPVTGSLPAGAATIQYTWGSYVPGANDGGGGTSNGAPSRTAVSSDPSAAYTTMSINSTNGGSYGRTYTFTIDIFDAAGTNISHTVTSIGAFVSGQG